MKFSTIMICISICLLALGIFVILTDNLFVTIYPMFNNKYAFGILIILAGWGLGAYNILTAQTIMIDASGPEHIVQERVAATAQENGLKVMKDFSNLKK